MIEILIGLFWVALAWAIVAFIAAGSRISRR